ncbi:MAG: protein kinase [Myxococcota bacterium]|nr:protein kinase [Myxococcota bacterium]
MTLKRRPEDSTPQRLGRYRLVRPISTGGMARVYEARLESMAGVSPKVAIKVILPEHARDDAFRQLFINEANIGSRLRHQNIVQVTDFDADQGLFYLVMEYVEGVTLRQAIRRSRKSGTLIPLTIIAEVGRQVCDGLHHAHSTRSEDGRHLRLVHRDLKPSNLMLNPQGVVKLLDFGISKAQIAAERPGAVRGTWGYMAPEQAAGADVGPPADIFGLACVLYEMAALQPLFPEKQPDQIRALLARDEGARRASRLSGPHGDLAGILVRALQRDPQARYPSAAAMGRAISSLARDPVLAREQVIRFQQATVVLGKPGHRPAGARAVSSVDVSESDASELDAAGLPLRVGDVHRPEPIAPLPDYHTRSSTGLVKQIQAILAALFIGAALGIVGFTAWRVIAGGPSTPEAPALPVVIEPPKEPADLAPEPAVEGAAPERISAPPPVVRNPVEAAPPKTPTAPSPASPIQEVPAVSEAEPVVEDIPEEQPTSTSSVATRGLLTVGAIPRAQVLIDGSFIRYTPLFEYQISTGSHTVTLISETGERTSFTVGVLEDQEVRRIWSFEDNDWVQD